MKVLVYLFLFVLMTNTSMASYNFSLMYWPSSKHNCQAVSNKYIYAKKKNKYKFRVLFKKEDLPSKFLTQSGLENSPYEVRVHSVVRLGNKDSRPEIVTIKPDYDEFGEGVYLDSVDSPFKCVGKDCEFVYLKFSLNAPKDLKRDVVKYKEDVDFYHWDILALLVNKRTGKSVASSSYQLRLLAKDSVIYNKIPGTTRNYSLDAVVDSGLYDNFERKTPLGIHYTLRSSSANSSLKKMSYGAGVGVYFDPDSSVKFIDPLEDFGIIDTYGDGFFDGLFDTFTWNVGIYANASKTSSTKYRIGAHQNITHNFNLAPGESGLIFAQYHIEDAMYEVLSADRCGFLAKKEKRELSIHNVSYSLLLVDRDQYTQKGYVEKLAAEKLPTYEYVE